MDYASEGICITDPTRESNPLIYVNKGFLELTGYSHDDVIGKNPRFLQGEKTDPLVIRSVHNAIHERRSVQTEILNYRKDGEPFINKMSISPVFNEKKELTHFIGVQEDITIYKKKLEVDREIDRQRMMSEIMLQAAEKERKEIGMELHDSINQILTTAKLYLNYARDTEEVRTAMIEKSIYVINKAISEIRNLSGVLVGPQAKELSFKESLHELINTIKMASPFRLVYNDENLKEDLLTESKKVMLYRILQEQLTNIIRHANASLVTVSFSCQRNNLIVSISDNGIGFYAAQMVEGIGLRNIRSRVEIEQGSMQVCTAPGEGCELLLKIPLLD